MKSVVTSVFETLVSQRYGEEAWQQIHDAISADQVSPPPERSAHEQLERLIATASRILETPAPEIVHWFGRESIPLFAGCFPRLVRPDEGARNFIVTLNTIINPRIPARFPGIGVSDFEFGEANPDTLMVIYRSGRPMCGFARGLIEGYADHFHEEVAIEHPVCMHRGASECHLYLTFNHRD